jgi:pyruvate dehydrogenase kinase 2/3/4
LVVAGRADGRGYRIVSSIKKVKDWYAQSFEDITSLPRPNLDKEARDRLLGSTKKGASKLSSTTRNLSLTCDDGNSRNGNTKRYFVPAEDNGEWPPELADYNRKFQRALEGIKRRHDSVVTTVAQGINEYKLKKQRMQIDSSIQSFLDRFYMSRIGIRMLIGQHIALTDQTKHSFSRT